MDGARLWESGPFYAPRSYAEIAALFDTVYVSFYKGLAGLAGAALAGPAGVIDEARVWKLRHGGNLIRLYPYVVAARKGLDEKLPRMAAYHEKAVEIAAALAQLPGVDVVPNPPHAHMLHVFLHGDRQRLMEGHLAQARETGVWLFWRLEAGLLPNWSKFELSAGDATLDLPTAEIAELVAAVIERAGSREQVGVN
jgi:threonine aldolase